MTVPLQRKAVLLFAPTMNTSSYIRILSQLTLHCCRLPLVIALAVLLSCAQSVKPTAADYLAEAKSIIAAHPDSVQAYETLLRKALSQAGLEADWAAFSEVALLLSSQLQWTNEKEALSLALKAREMIGQCDLYSTALVPRINLKLAGLYEQMGDFARARLLYNQCLEDSVSQQTALGHLADMSLADGDPTAALALALEMQQSGSVADNVEAQFILANCYLPNDSLLKARGIYERLLACVGSKTRYAAQRHLAEIAIQDNRTTDLHAILDSAFASAEAVEHMRQQEQKIELLQRYILEKSELLQRLRAEGDHKRLLSLKDWTDMEKLLDSITDGFVAKLRAQHPEFREDDIQLCMLTRMNLSNLVISDIYLITVSAVKHRKLKLKKEGFGVSDPDRPLGEVLARI